MTSSRVVRFARVVPLKNVGERTDLAQNTEAVFQFAFHDVMCRGCSFVFSKTRRRDAYLDRYYSDYFPSLSQVSKEEVQSRIDAIMSKTTLDIDVLECGGGFSASANASTAHGARVSGIDPS